MYKISQYIHIFTHINFSFVDYIGSAKYFKKFLYYFLPNKNPKLLGWGVAYEQICYFLSWLLSKFYCLFRNLNSLGTSPNDMSSDSRMTSSCTLPSSTWQPRKHSWANELDDDSESLLARSDTLKRLVTLARRTGDLKPYLLY